MFPNVLYETLPPKFNGNSFLRPYTQHDSKAGNIYQNMAETAAYTRVAQQPQRTSTYLK